ncbi:hypothetical protein [Flavobacterium sp. PS2]|uniref:hypothetical protein n=1 Tax=Flavobacterium sp. PS2 TaxID=3384157 RepID=UPI00390C7A1B
MKKIMSVTLLVLFFINCKDVDKSTKISKNKIGSTGNLKEECIIDSIELQTSEYNGIRFYTENKLRGKGVISISINQKIEIFNIDKTVFGDISLIKNDDETLYKIDLPKKVIVREIMPDQEIQVFSFDAELPETDNNFIILYINQERKLIAKKNIKYTFLSWEKYIKSSFIQLTSNVKDISNEEKNYWYQALQIKGDSMKIKSIKTSCEYTENYKDFTKWIKWKNDSCKLIKFNFCY